MDLRDYALVVRARWRVVAVVTLLVLGVAVALTARATPKYTASMRMFVSTTGAPGSGGIYQGSLYVNGRVSSYADIVDSPTVLQPVIEQLDLPYDAGQLSEEVSANVPQETSLIDVTVIDSVPTRARDVANAIGRTFPRVVEQLEPTDGGGAPVKVSMVQTAGTPTAPTSPRWKLNLALGLLLGLGLGVAGAVTRESWDRTVRSADMLEKLVGLPTLALVPRDPTASKHPTIAGTSRRPSNRLEAFRRLRTGVQYLDPAGPPRSVLVTSAAPGEGKSSVCVNLALSFARTHKRVALVDADLREPRLSRYLGCPAPAGLTNVLKGEMSLEEVLVTRGDGLLFLPSGPPPEDPSELLSSPQADEVFAALLDRAEVLLVDAPPVLPVTDAAVLATITDGVLLVVHHASTRRTQLQTAVRELAAVDARILGAVLNMVPTRGPESYDDSYGFVRQRALESMANGQATLTQRTPTL